MGVTYEKLRIIMVKLKIKPTDIQKSTNLSWGSLTNINNDKYVNISTLETIVKFLNDTYDKNYDIGDLVEIKKDSTSK